MKYDKDKPQARKFYWNGLAKLAEPQQAALIRSYEQFSTDPSLSYLKVAFESCKALNVPQLDEIVGRIYDHGAEKYGDKNYLGLTVDRFSEAMGRHIRAAILTNQLDASGYPHLGHVMANILIAAELID